MAAGLRTGAHRRPALRPRMGRSSFGLPRNATTENAKPGAWNMWRAKHPGWPHIFGKTEWRLEWLVYWCRDLAIFEVLEFVGRVSVLVAVIVWFWEWEDRTKQSHYRAWELINSARGSTGDGGRRDALQDLNEDNVNLSAAPLAKAYLAGVQLPRTRLSGADLSEAYLVRAHLVGADLSKAHLVGANLFKANLSGANLNGADLNGADLNGADLSEAYLVGANLIRAKLFKANLSGANLDLTDLNQDSRMVLGMMAGISEGIRHTQFCQTIMPDGTVNNRDCPPEPAPPTPSETTPIPR
jgi:hypothetical protein